MADALRVLYGAGAERAVVGGLSMGAAVALRLAVAHPERVRALVLASFPPGRHAAGGVSARAVAFADAIEREGLEAAGARFVWVADSGLDERGAALVRQGFLEHPPHAMVHTLRRFLAGLPSVEALAPEVAELRIPSLVVVGERDTPALASSRTLARLLPDARGVEVADAGHVVNLDARATFDRELRDFLSGLGPRG